MKVHVVLLVVLAALALAEVRAATQLNQDNLIVSDVEDHAGLSVEAEHTRKCGDCMAFVEKVRRENIGESTEACPIRGNSMCPLWHEERDRHTFLKHIKIAKMCAKEICVRWRKCKRNRCEACQVMVTPAAYLLVGNGGRPAAGAEKAKAWLNERFGPNNKICRRPGFAKWNAKGLCNNAVIQNMIGQLDQFSKMNDEQATLGMCKSIGDCGAQDPIWRACPRERERLPVLSHKNGCAYHYKFEQATKMMMGGLVRSSFEHHSHKAKAKSVVGINAELYVTKHGDTKEGCAIFELYFKRAGVDTGKKAESLTERLQQHPVYFQQCHSGEIPKIYYSPFETLKMLTLKLQVVKLFHFHSGGGKDVHHHDHDHQYTVEEADADGVTEVQYNVHVKDGGDLEFHHKKAKQARDLKAMNKSSKSVSNVESLHDGSGDKIVMGVLKKQKLTGGHLLESNALPDTGLKGGMSSFTLRVNEADRLSFQNKDCGFSTPDIKALSDAEIGTAVQDPADSTSHLVVGLLQDQEESEANGDFFTESIDAQAADSSEYASSADELVAVTDGTLRLLATADLGTGDAYVEALDQLIRKDTTGRVVHRVGRSLMAADVEEAADGLPTMLLQGEAVKGVRAAVVRMLVSHDDGATLDVVHQLLNHEGTSVYERDTLVHSLLTLAKPTHELLSYVANLATTAQAGTQLHHSALSVWSAMAGKVPASHPLHIAVRGKAVALLQQSDEAGDADGVTLALVALGNLGSRSDLHTVSTYLQAHDSVVREQAATSLRRMQGDDVTNILISHFVEEPSEVGRLATLDALVTRQPTHSEWLSLANKLRAGAHKYPACSEGVAGRLAEVLSEQGITAKLTQSGSELPSQEAMSLLDEEDDLDLDLDLDADLDADPIKTVKTGIDVVKKGIKFAKGEEVSHKITIGDKTYTPTMQLRQPNEEYKLDKMWGSKDCAVKGDAFKLSRSADQKFGTKSGEGKTQFQAQIYGTLLAKGQMTNGDFCALVGAEAGTRLTILGKKIPILGFRLESQHSKKQRIARPVVILYTFQLSVMQFKMDTKAAESVTSTLCTEVTPFTVFPPPSAKDRTKNPVAGAPTSQPVSIKMENYSKFTILVTIRYAMFAIRVGLVVGFEAGLIIEPCQALGPGHFTAGVAPYVSVNVFAEGGLDVAVAGAGVGINLQMLQGDVVMNGAFYLADKEDKPCPQINQGLAVHLNWQALAGEIYAYTSCLGAQKKGFSMCFPDARTDVPNAKLPTTALVQEGDGSSSGSFGPGFSSMTVTEMQIQHLDKWFDDVKAYAARKAEEAKAAVSAGVNSVSTMANTVYDKVAEHTPEVIKKAARSAGTAVSEAAKAVARTTVKAARAVHEAAHDTLHKLKEMVSACKKGVGFMYSGLQPLYAKCLCADGSPTKCPPRPAIKYRKPKFTGIPTPLGAKGDGHDRLDALFNGVKGAEGTPYWLKHGITNAQKVRNEVLKVKKEYDAAKKKVDKVKKTIDTVKKTATTVKKVYDELPETLEKAKKTTDKLISKVEKKNAKLGAALNKVSGGVEKMVKKADDLRKKAEKKVLETKDKVVATAHYKKAKAVAEKAAAVGKKVQTRIKDMKQKVDVKVAETKKTIRHQYQRARKAIRETGDKILATDRKEGERTVKEEKAEGHEIKKEIRTEQTKNRATTRNSSKRVARRERKQTKENKGVSHRAEARAKAATAAVGKTQRRAANEVKSELETQAKEATARKTKKLMRRDERKEQKKADEVVRSMIRHEDRRDERHTMRKEKKEEKSEIRELRRKEEAETLEGQFRHMRHLEKREEKKEATAREMAHLKRVMKRKEDAKSKERSRYKSVERQLSRLEHAKVERARLARLRKEETKAVKGNNQEKSEVDKIKKELSHLGHDVRKAESEENKKIAAVAKRERVKALQRRALEKTSQLVKRKEADKNAAARQAHLTQSIHGGFRNTRKELRAAARESKETIKKKEAARHRHHQQHKLKKLIAKTKARVKKITDKSAAKVEKIKLAHMEEKLHRMQAKETAKLLKAQRKATRKQGRKNAKTLRELHKKQRETIRKNAKRVKEVAEKELLEAKKAAGVDEDETV